MKRLAYPALLLCRRTAAGVRGRVVPEYKHVRVETPFFGAVPPVIEIGPLNDHLAEMAAGGGEVVRYAIERRPPRAYQHFVWRKD